MAQPKEKATKYVLVEASDDEKASSEQTNRPIAAASAAGAIATPQQAKMVRLADLIGPGQAVKPVNERKTVFPDLRSARAGRAALTLEEAKSRALKSNQSAAGMVLMTRLVADEGASSSGAGTCYNAYNVYTDATSGVLNLGEFADFSALFREYRIAKIKFTYVPFTPAKTEANTNTNGRALVVALDPDNDATPSSNLQVFANSNAGVFSNQNPAGYKRTWKNSDKRWFDSLDSANPLVPQMSIKVAGDANLGTSIPFGVFYFEYFVEFRARL